MKDQTSRTTDRARNSVVACGLHFTLARMQATSTIQVTNAARVRNWRRQVADIAAETGSRCRARGDAVVMRRASSWPGLSPTCASNRPQNHSRRSLVTPCRPIPIPP